MKAQSGKANIASSDVPMVVHDVLRSSGQPLDAGTRAYMEPRFGHDFSRLRVHTDARAAESARAVHAQAFTVGSDIVFGSGAYSPSTHAGRQLVAHEMAHVVQQGASSPDTVVQRFTDFNYGLLPDDWEPGSPTSGPRRRPTPTPPPPIVAGVCGPNVTTQTIAAINKTRDRFTNNWSADEKQDACDALTSWFTGGRAWDINELHNNAWIYQIYRPACATQGANPACGSSVQIHNDCHYAGSVNYVIFGVMCDLCHRHFVSIGSSDAEDFTEDEMLDLIDLYKGTGWTGLSTPSGNFAESRRWASAGYHGWPSVASPAGDRSNCMPTCPTPYGGPDFLVHWIPMGWF